MYLSEQPRKFTPSYFTGSNRHQICFYCMLCHFNSFTAASYSSTVPGRHNQYKLFFSIIWQDLHLKRHQQKQKKTHTITQDRSQTHDLQIGRPMLNHLSHVCADSNLNQTTLNHLFHKGFSTRWETEVVKENIQVLDKIIIMLPGRTIVQTPPTTAGFIIIITFYKPVFFGIINRLCTENQFWHV